MRVVTQLNAIAGYVERMLAAGQRAAGCTVRTGVTAQAW